MKWSKKLFFDQYWVRNVEKWSKNLVARPKRAEKRRKVVVNPVLKTKPSRKKSRNGRESPSHDQTEPENELKWSSPTSSSNNFPHTEYLPFVRRAIFD